MKEEEIVQRIKALYPTADIDVAGEDCSFEVYVICDDFEQMNTLKRQQSILALFKDDLTTGKLHALGIKAKTKVELASNSGLLQIQS